MRNTLLEPGKARQFKCTFLNLFIYEHEPKKVYFDNFPPQPIKIIKVTPSQDQTFRNVYQRIEKELLNPKNIITVCHNLSKDKEIALKGIKNSDKNVARVRDKVLFSNKSTTSCFEEKGNTWEGKRSKKKI